MKIEKIKETFQIGLEDFDVFLDNAYPDGRIRRIGAFERLFSIEEAEQAIEAFKFAIQRLKEAGFDKLD